MEYALLRYWHKTYVLSRPKKIPMDSWMFICTLILIRYYMFISTLIFMSSLSCLYYTPKILGQILHNLKYEIYNSFLI